MHRRRKLRLLPPTKKTGASLRSEAVGRSPVKLGQVPTTQSPEQK
jgi:hypothetical protein